MIAKGANCSVQGKMYEHQIHRVLRHTTLFGKLFHTQKEEELGGCSSANDLVCEFGEVKVGIEAKKAKTPDWMQCSIRYHADEKKWGIVKGVIPDLSKQIFNSILEKVVLFEGQIPPFLDKPMTHPEWLAYKSENKCFRDMYLDVAPTTIRDLYKAKGCGYIQISEYGLYHLGEDICGFGVPEFVLDQHIRIRIKIHTRKNTKGFCQMSVMAACKPNNIRTLVKSPFSLDSITGLPPLLTYNNNLG